MRVSESLKPYQHTTNSIVDEKIEMQSIYKKEAQRVGRESTLENVRKASQKIVKFSAEHEIGKFIKKYGFKIDFGTYEVPKDFKAKSGEVIRTAGIWKMEKDREGNAVFVKNYTPSVGNVKKGDNLTCVADFSDIYGTKIVSGQYMKIMDAYDDVIEAKVIQTGNTHVCYASALMESSKTRDMDTRNSSQKKTAAIVVPNKFKEMIKTKTGYNDEELDMHLWADFTSKANNQLNNYDLMKNYVDTLFISASSKNTQNRKAVDEAAKRYYEELFKDTDPEYAKELTASEKMKMKVKAIRNEFEFAMSHAPSKNAMVHYNNTLAKLSHKFKEPINEIINIVNSKKASQADEFSNLYEVNISPTFY